MKKIHGILAMTAATVIWGFAFSAQSKGMEHVGPVLFVMLRSIAGTFALSLSVMFFDIIFRRKVSFWGGAETPVQRRNLLVGGILCGVLISAASVCQQIGLQSTSAGKSGFLTALYIIIVPVLGIFFRRKTNFVLWVAVVIALGGAYLLTGGVDNIGRGELFLLLCSFLFSIHILLIDRFAPQCDCVRLSCCQFAAASIFSGLFSLCLQEAWIIDQIMKSLPFWMFCGVGSSAIAFTLQMAAQKVLHPVTASLLMSLESVFAVLGGWIFLSESLSVQEGIGCAVIFAAIILTQVPSGAIKRQ